jgi:hypothetical protein
MTSKALTAMGVRHFIVVEPHEVDIYRRACAGSLATVVELDLSYKERYELCDDLGLSKSTGPGPARNFIWDHSIANGHDWHWVMDDNIKHFYRAVRNTQIRMGDGLGFRAMEDFCLRYANVAMAGPNYEMFVKRRDKVPPFIKNTRIYSCNLIRNDLKYRWRGRYNEDTILSLDMLKGGWCTIQFNAFLQQKLNTQKLGGGNTAEFYAKEGTLPKSRMLVQEHPDVSRLAYRYDREHHHVDYGPFKHLRLILRDDVEIPEENPYTMTVKRIK